MLEIFNKIPVYTLLLLSAASVITGDFFAKYWSLHRKPIFFAVALFGYFLSGLFYIPTLLREGLVLTSMIWSLLSILGFLFIGFIIFREHLSTLEIAGVILGTAALLILSYKAV